MNGKVRNKTQWKIESNGKVIELNRKLNLMGKWEIGLNGKQHLTGKWEIEPNRKAGNRAQQEINRTQWEIEPDGKVGV